MTQTRALLGGLAALCVSAAPAEAQLVAHHHLAFAVGDENAKVAVRVSGLTGTELLVRMPAWYPVFTPGIRSARPPAGWKLRATRGETALTINPRLPQSLWTISTGGATTITLHHEIPIVGRTVATGLGQRNPHTFRKAGAADGKPETMRYHESFVLRGGSTWLEVPGAKQRLTVALPPGFEVATALPRSDDGSYAAVDYATLAGSPLHIGKFKTTQFAVDGIAHHVVFSGFDRDRTDRKEFTDRLAKIIRANRFAMGPLPYSDYVFLFGRKSDQPSATGHSRCAEIVTHQLRSSPILLRHIARAHLAAWNGKFFHPAARDSQGSIERHTLTKEAWFWLGVEEYHAELAIVRAGLEKPDPFWTRTIAAQINRLQRDSRRLKTSVAATGARIRAPKDVLRPGAPHPRLVGQLLCLLLDVEIRANTGGKMSLDHAVRGLARQCAARRRGYTNADIRDWCEKTGGRKFANIFACVTSIQELPLTATLAKAGVEAHPGLQATPKKTKNKRVPEIRRRAPRWRITLAPKPPDAALRLRTSLTKQGD
jgi:hypothetical protein